MSTIPEEILSEILLKLPVKPLVRFKCVSKSWLALISSPEFVKAHLHSSLNSKDRSRHRVMLGFRSYVKDCSLSSLLYSPTVTEACDINYPLKGHRVMCVGSVNGLLCFARICFSGSTGVYLYLWNPSTKKFKELPYIYSRLTTYFKDFKFGFGYDELHDDYKVVVTTNIWDLTIGIYSVKTNCWRTMKDYKDCDLIDGFGKFVGGKLYWITDAKDIFSLNLADETWGRVEQPNFGQGEFNMVLGVSAINLLVLCNHEDHSDIWIMKDGGVKASWTKMFTINCYNDPLRFCVSNAGEILLLFHSSFVIYNPKDGSIRKPEVMGIEGCVEAEVYVESLVVPET